MTLGRPRVSICIPTYNHARFVGDAVRGALSQSERDLEVVVIDDGSTDETLAICSAFDDERLRVSSNPTRLGVAGNFNACLRAARGAYVKVLCDDDILMPGCVEALADALDANPSCVIATSRRVRLTNDGREEMLSASFPPHRPILRERVLAESKLWRNIVGEPSTVLLRVSALPACGFDEQMRQMMDWDLWLRMLGKGDLVYIPDVLSVFRWHGENMSERNRQGAWAARDLLRIARKLEGDESVSQFRIALLRVLCLLRGMRGVVESAWVRSDEGLEAAKQTCGEAMRSLLRPR